MRMFLRRALDARVVSSLFGLSALLVLGGFSWGYVSLRGSPSVILHFGATSFDRAAREIINHYGVPEDLFRVGFLGIVMVCVNFLISLELERRDTFMARFVAIATLVFSVLLFIGIAAIMSVN